MRKYDDGSRRYFIIVTVGILACICTRIFGDLSSQLHGITSSFKGIGHTFSKMGGAMKQQFTGSVPSCYSFNCVAYNDSLTSPVKLKDGHVIGVMGVNWRTSDRLEKGIAPNSNSGSDFHDRKLNCKEELKNSSGDVLVWRAITESPVYKNDTSSTYFFRAYEGKGGLKGEYLGKKTTSTEFSGAFYNSSSEVETVTFTKDGKTYTATLEPGSYNLLASSTGVVGSIRPKKGQEAHFEFNKSKTKAPISEEGIANVPATPKKGAKAAPPSPSNYIYEVYSDGGSLKVGTQGIDVGNFYQPMDGKVRDLSPAKCYVWHMSAEQKGTPKTKSDSGIPLDAPGQLWYSYKTGDQAVSGSVPLGKSAEFQLLRPRLSEDKAMLYVVLLDSQDKTQADKFLTRLSSGKIGKNVVDFTGDLSVEKIKNYIDATGSPDAKEQNLLTQLTPDDKGQIDDKDGSGVSGNVLLADVLYPHGVGDGPFYYTIPPATLHSSQLATMVQGHLDASKLPKGFDLSKTAEGWVTLHSKNPGGVRLGITDLLTKYGVSGLVDSKGALSSNGLRVLDNIMSGPVSVEKPPMQLSAGSNNYLSTFGEKPKGWPSETKEDVDIADVIPSQSSAKKTPGVKVIKTTSSKPGAVKTSKPAAKASVKKTGPGVKPTTS